MKSDQIFESYLTKRSRSLNSKPIKKSGTHYVLCWLQQTLRGVNNPVIDAAIAFSRQLNQPVLIYHGLGQHYPHASDRFHQFILEASKSLEEDAARRGLKVIRFVESQSNPHNGIFYTLAKKASLVVLDDQPAFVGRWHAQSVANKLERRVVAVDGARLIPEIALGSTFSTTPSFRARHTSLRSKWLDEPNNLSNDLMADVNLPDNATPINMLQSNKLGKLISDCDIDHTVPPVQWCSGSRRSAIKHLNWAMVQQFPNYASKRNNPSETGTTYLSPYLHFGVLGPGDVVAAVNESDASSRDSWKFLDELLTWREYFHHRAFNTPDPTSYDNLPTAAKASLSSHSSDSREHLYPLGTLIHGETDDAVWNVGQRQFLRDGWMHNNLRMYWGKRLLAWTKTPQIAWQTACYINDRFSLDGRDPATYGSMQWCFGASKPSKDKPVYGTVPIKSNKALLSKSGMTQWLNDELEKAIPRVAVPQQPTVRSHPKASGSVAAQLALNERNEMRVDKDDTQ